MSIEIEKHVLTRELLASGAFGRLAEPHPALKFLSPVALQASLDDILSKHPAGSFGTTSEPDIWVFGYGSLLWNPAFHHVEQRLGKVFGWHRRFCLWANVTRGDVERPGLVLGLEAGGSCAGMAFRIAGADARTELALLWQREMITGSYVPRWISVRSATGERFPAITFTINLRHEHYAGGLSDIEVARVLASASGTLGRCADYYFSTLKALQQLGISDRRLQALHLPVTHFCAEQAKAAYSLAAAE